MKVEDTDLSLAYCAHWGPGEIGSVVLQTSQRNVDGLEGEADGAAGI